MNLRAVDETLTHLYEVKLPDVITPRATGHNGQLKGAPALRATMFWARSSPDAAIVCRSARCLTTALIRPARRNTKSAISRAKCRSGNRKSAFSVANACWSVRTPSFAAKFTMCRCSKMRPRRSNRMRRGCRNGKACSYTLQVAVEDCTGCGICVDVCPARNKSEARLKAINMQPQLPLREAERENWNFFLSIAGTRSRPDLE